MKIDLAAFRLNALSTLTANDSKGSSNTDFLSALLNARMGNLPDAAGATGAISLLGDTGSQIQSVLSQLEASNAAFLRRYNARVDAIGDEAQVLTRLRERVAELGTASQGLSGLRVDSADTDIKAALQDFIARYNAWDSEFDPYFEDGALLDDVQAGETARFSLRREVGSIFHGAGNGGFDRGLTAMGVSFSSDGQLRFDEASFDAALGSDRAAAVQTLSNVARAFGDAAEMLSADGHLLARRIDNAQRAVDWAADNRDDLNAEFGPGAVAARLRRAGYS